MTNDGVFRANDAERVISFGLSMINERHLNSANIGELALEGLKGLSTIDPALTVRSFNGRVTLSNVDRVLVDVAEPAPQDRAGWSSLTVKMYEGARKHSPNLAQSTVEDFYEAVFDSTLAKLDRFSRYAGFEDASRNRSSRNGFGGVGIRFEKKGDLIEIMEVVSDGPGASAGLKAGDRIRSIDGVDVASLETDKISELLRGAISSQVELLIQRHDRDMVQVAVRRALIVPPSVELSLEGNLAVVKVTSFNQRTAADFSAKLLAAREQVGPALGGVVLDLRGNPGGLLDQAVSVADLFMDNGPIVSTRGRHTQATQFYSASPGDFAEDLPLIVLIDGKSASSSELLAAALQDSGRAVVIGTNSYGKGTVQTVIRMPNEGEMTLTWSRFHSPSGYALHGLGVLPNICTSDEAADPRTLLRNVVHNSGPTVANLTVWRSTSVDETGLRQELRSSCPSQRHMDTAIDVELAKTILGDRDLYARALSISAPMGASHAHDGRNSINSGLTAAEK